MKKMTEESVSRKAKKFRDDLRQITILLSTAREEGDPEEHEQTLDLILKLFISILPEEKENGGTIDPLFGGCMGWNDYRAELLGRLK